MVKRVQTVSEDPHQRERNYKYFHVSTRHNARQIILCNKLASMYSPAIILSHWLRYNFSARQFIHCYILARNQAAVSLNCIIKP